MRSIKSFIDIIAGILTIFNFVLAVPSVFENIDGFHIFQITDQNFTLKLGFIMILELGFGYILTSLLIGSDNISDSLRSHSSGVLIILVSAWLTFFNITEILYYKICIESFWGLFSFVMLSLIVQCFLILTASGGINWTGSRIFWIIFLIFFEITYFVVYVLNYPTCL